MDTRDRDRRRERLMAIGKNAGKRVALAASDLGDAAERVCGAACAETAMAIILEVEKMLAEGTL